MRAILVVLGVSLLAPLALAADVVVNREEVLVPRERVADTVRVRDVVTRGETVSGTVTNVSSQRLKDVHLSVRYMWLWNNEMHPGTDDRSYTEEFTLERELGPGESAAFTHGVREPLSTASDGHYQTMVEPVSFVTYADQPRSGTASAPPPPTRDETSGAPRD
jgi:hypothetical protein